MDFFISSAYGQSTAAAGAGQFSFASFVPFLLIFFVFYFLLIKPQQKKIQEEAKFNKTLEKGDEIYTKSGVLGKVTGLTEKIATLDLGEGNKMKILRTQIAGSTKNIFSSETK